MDLHTVTITSNGVPAPPAIQVFTGDIVAFVADNTDAVLCFDMAGLFGMYRYEIPNGTTLPLVVIAVVEVATPVAYTVKTNLGAECFPRSTNEGTITVLSDDDREEKPSSGGGD